MNIIPNQQWDLKDENDFLVRFHKHNQLRIKCGDMLIEKKLRKIGRKKKIEFLKGRRNAYQRMGINVAPTGRTMRPVGFPAQCL